MLTRISAAPSRNVQCRSRPLASSPDDFVSYYSRALQGAFFTHAATLNEFRRISSGFQDEIRSAMDVVNQPTTDAPPAEPTDPTPDPAPTAESTPTTEPTPTGPPYPRTSAAASSTMRAGSRDSTTR